MGISLHMTGSASQFMRRWEGESLAGGEQVDVASL
jgi:hypothetical protein